MQLNNPIKHLRSQMNAIIETPYYNDFCKWIASGQPRSATGKPTLTTLTRAAQPVAQRATPAAAKRTGRSPNSNHGRNKTAEGAAAREYVAKCAEPPNAAEMAQRFGLSREHCHTLISRRFGPRGDTKHLPTIIAYLKTQHRRPTGVSIANMFKCSQATASRAIGDVFGKAEPDAQKIAARDWVNEQTVRPRINAVIEKFGVSSYYAKLLVNKKFGTENKSKAISAWLATQPDGVNGDAIMARFGVCRSHANRLLQAQREAVAK